MADEKVIFTMTGVTKYFEKKPVFRDISLSYYYGAKIGVLGLNGSGKSSLLRILTGVEAATAGTVTRARGLVASLAPQEVPDHLLSLTLHAAVLDALEPAEREEFLRLLRKFVHLNTPAPEDDDDKPDQPSDSA